MTTEKVLLSQLKVNRDNPRSITEHKLTLLVERLLAFPKMITIRPVVVDNAMVALGGNMRIRAFQEIAKKSINDIATILAGTKNFQRLSQAEQEQLLAQWQEWLENPVVDIARADQLTEAEKKEFIIADNASFGSWDYDKLANEWEADDLNSWGLDVWRPDPAGTFAPSTSPTASPAPFDPSGLPTELQGATLTPDELPKIEGDDQVLLERIIIVYPKERTDEIAKMCGLETIDKVVYSIDELIPLGE